MVSYDSMFNLQTAVGVLTALLLAGCGLFCFVYRRLSPWLMLMSLGFFGEFFVRIIDWIFWVANLHGDLISIHVMQLFILGSTLCFVMAVFLTLLGLVLALGDISRRMARLGEASGEMRDRLPSAEARETWRLRQEGSPDIQR